MKSAQLVLYTVHHFNMCFSSIEEEQRSEVIRRCYWPLLQLAEELQVPIGVEASGYTLEVIQEIDAAWVSKLRELCCRGLVEFIGSGYSQLIGPLVPAEVNGANLHFGHEVYERLLGFRPTTAFINEQAYSAGLISLYKQAGYQAIVMEWENPARHHKEWDASWRYYPQYARGIADESIALIWNHSIAFQKFQRYVHGDMEIADYYEYLLSHVGQELRYFPLYGNDIEIFDFRPGRYHTEAALAERYEWQRIKELYQRLLDDPRFAFVLPGKILSGNKQPLGGNLLRLESAEQPIPVKKQEKYNVTRWAVTGRDDVGSNTVCWRLYQVLCMRDQGWSLQEDWKKLCYLWSSDFRTHITEKRWEKYQLRLQAMEQKLGVKKSREPEKSPDLVLLKTDKRVIVEGHIVTIETDKVRLQLNCKKGLAIHALYLEDKRKPMLCGTLAHGFYDDISMGADWYTGHTVFELVGQPKVTDLCSVQPKVWVEPESGDILVSAQCQTTLGSIEKWLRVSAKLAYIELSYSCLWDSMPLGSLRLGSITLNPAAFDQASLVYGVCNGGNREYFPLAGKQVELGKAVSFLVSAQSGLGVTDGRVILGDAARQLVIEVDKAAAALIGLLQYREYKDTYYCRLNFSAGEVDETRKLGKQGTGNLQCKIRIGLQ